MIVSQAGEQRRRQAGFSLVELLVVLLIIGLGVKFVSSTGGDNSTQQLRAQARTFANHTALLAEEAVLANQQWGVDIYREIVDGEDRYGYRWLRRNNDKKWQLAYLPDSPEDVLFDRGIELSLTLDGLGEKVEIDEKREIDDWQDPRANQLLTDEERQSITEQLAAKIEDQSEPVLPSIWLLSSGEISAFNLSIISIGDADVPGSEDSVIYVVGDALGRIKLSSELQEDE
ncbi:MAG: type II secretion system protein H [Oceanicoccus sp.]|jgi:type II secretion system protein H